MNDFLLPLLFSMVIESAQPSQGNRVILPVQSLVQKELCPHPKILQENFLMYFLTANDYFFLF